MIAIVYPGKKPVIKEEAGKELIFCPVRKKWVLLTPEEWVRQNIILYLTETMQYPVSLMAVEKQLVLGDIKKRFDIVVYRQEKPFVLIECKEMNVPITQRTLDQVLRYNISLQAVYFIVTNGTGTYGFTSDNGQLTAIDQFPVF